MTPRVAFGARVFGAVALGGVGVVAALGVAQLLWLTPIPEAPTDSARMELRDRHGALLRGARDARARHHLPTPGGVERGVVGAAFVASEDRRIDAHPGFDWRAAARACATLLRHGRVRSGASTMAMQLARLREGRSPGVDPWHKLRDVVLAWRITRALGPEGVLRAYLDEVPLGPRVVGVEAAAWRTFGKSSRDLDAAEAAVLATFARAPTSAVRAASSEATRARVQWRAAQVIRRMAEDGSASRDDVAAVSVVVASLVGERPRGVAHAMAARLDRERASRSTLEPRLGVVLDRALRAGLASVRDRGVTHASGLVVDVASRDVLAAATVGADDDPWFDGTAARRQPGSTLKPLVVALALEELATDDLVVRDAPIAFEGEDDVFEPRNYDGRFHGDVPVEDVLARSLNVPALRVAARLGPPRLLAFLRAAGFASLEESPAYYGVNLALGDGEVTLAELGAAYAALADDGRYLPLRWNHDAPQAAPRRVVDADVARIVARMLDDDARRAPTFDRDGVFAAPYPLAVKTGTSREHRDAWAIGFTPRLVAAVWMGRADGGATREVNGARGPGPALRAIVDASDPPRGAFPAPSSERWTEVRACIGAGDARSTRCERERLVFRRRAGARDAHSDTGSVEQEAQRDRPPRFVFPADGARLLRDPGRPDEALGLRVLVEGPPASAELVVRDGARTFAVRPGTPLALPLTAGVHRLVLEEAGRAVDARVVRVANAP